MKRGLHSVLCMQLGRISSVYAAYTLRAMQCKKMELTSIGAVWLMLCASSRLFSQMYSSKWIWADVNASVCKIFTCYKRSWCFSMARSVFAVWLCPRPCRDCFPDHGPLPSNRQHSEINHCLEDNREDY